MDDAMEGSREGMRALGVSLGVLGATTVIQGTVVAVERVLGGVEGVRGVGPVRVRWVGHRLRVEADIVVDARLSVVAAHEVAVAAEHALLHRVPRLAAATLHPDPEETGGADHHAVPAGHRPAVSAPP
ncbi:cation transporter dimerization domain-containing protein [Actinomadura kijaniata]|uniref:cation transporter dimerization domain-containing protein n=1 Tax=Actinomadura kijaniata TaxID=46161 RepID=UPI00082D642E|nr:cation transporter dimerization domain-containing protein [Actinomadura kijaniata]